MDLHERVSQRLKLRDLRLLLSVVQWGSMAKAAAQLNLTQSGVSRAIADMEHTLGVRLFDRTSQGVEPTPYGSALRKWGNAVFDDLRQGVKEIEFLADPTSGELRVGFSEVPAAGLVPAAIDRLMLQYPRMVVHTEQGDARTILGFLRDRRCEVAVARIAAEPDIDVQPVHYDRLFVVAGARSKWAQQRKISLVDLADEPWVQSRPEMEPGSPTLEAFRKVGLSGPRAAVFSSSLNLRYGLLATGRFVTMIHDSALYFRSSRDPIRILPVKLPRWHIPTCIVTLKYRTLSPLGQLFVDCVRELAKQLAKQRIG